jgi:two-component system, chemotaxis family, CheB/CheR fusion protein
MPRAAIATGMVDWVLPVAEMPKRLGDYHRNEGRVRLPREHGPQLARPVPPPVPEEDTEAEAALREILSFLRARTGRDFSYYKRATSLRRIGRRMQVNGLVTLPEYLCYLRTQQGEVSALLPDLLISVTNFFRDDDAFKALEKQIPTRHECSNEFLAITKNSERLGVR